MSAQSAPKTVVEEDAKGVVIIRKNKRALEDANAPGEKKLASVASIGGKSGQKLAREYKLLVEEMSRDSLIGVGAQPIGENLMKWQAVIEGPSDSPYAGAWFSLTLEFTSDYPHKPPTVKFDHDLYHPNIYPTRGICLDILGDKWSPIYQISTVLVSIRSLLTDPNPDSPANGEAARFYRASQDAYAIQVRQCIQGQKRDVLPLPDWYIALKKNHQ